MVVTTLDREHGQFLLTVFVANFGRHVSPHEFKQNVIDVLDPMGDHAVLGISELDEYDRPDEHGITDDLLEPGTTKVGWGTFEPILISPGLKVTRKHVWPACEGVAHQTPNRTWVEARFRWMQNLAIPPIVVLNSHAPRNVRPGQAKADVVQLVQERRADCREVHEERLDFWWEHDVTTIWTGDMNDESYPRLHKQERTAVHAGLDYIRYVEHPLGAQLELLKTGMIDLTIDGHNAHWARFRVTAAA